MKLGRPAGSPDLEEGIDLDGDAPGKRIDADGRAGVTSALAEDGHHQIGGPVHHLRLIREIGAVDEAARADATDDPIEISATGVANRRQDMQRAETRGLLTLFDGEFPAQLADEDGSTLPDRNLSRDIDQAADDGVG